MYQDLKEQFWGMVWSEKLLHIYPSVIFAKESRLSINNLLDCCSHYSQKKKKCSDGIKILNLNHFWIKDSQSFRHSNLASNRSLESLEHHLSNGGAFKPFRIICLIG
jgi:hypothetical protein